MEDVIWQRDDIRDLKSEHFADKIDCGNNIDEPPVLISKNKIPTTFAHNQESNDEKNNLEPSSTSSSSSCLLKAFGTCLQTLKFPIDAFDENKTQYALDDETRGGETRSPFDQPKRVFIQNTQVDMRINPNAKKSNFSIELSEEEGVYLSDHPKRLLKLTDTEKRELLNGVIAEFSGNFPPDSVHVCRCRDAGVCERSSVFSENESNLSLTSSRQLSLMKCASNGSVLPENGSSLMVAINEFDKQNTTCKFCFLYHNNFLSN